ncbi:SUMF1/EgtB/PvdO family nonheme iron enzyme [candidate division KSB1 bacterium]|nr:SUMF1/EgtB/PvdO family nonheme iron enzyme [candidate division KSB1 bacterium]
MRALRGGSWNNNPERLQCDARNRNNPDNRNNNNGFRVVCLQSCPENFLLVPRCRYFMEYRTVVRA